MDKRLKALEAGRLIPETRAFLQHPGESIEQLRARAAAWQAQSPKTRCIEPLLIARRAMVRA